MMELIYAQTNLKCPKHKKDFTMRSDNPFQVTIADNVWRAEKFRTYTILAEECGKKVVYKCAATEKAKPFIKNIAEIEKANSEYLKGRFDVLCGRLQGGRIKYDYLTYPSLKDRIAFQMKEGCYDKANELFEKYINKIRSLKIIKTMPKEFLKVLANDSDDYCLKTDCLTRGLLDLTPDNILTNGNHWIVIDNEWSFDFPVPVIFIIFRAIRALAFALQPEIRKTASKANPVVGIFAGRFKTYYIPILWMKYITYYGISLWKMFRWETGFQRYVTGDTGTLAFRVRENPNIRTRFLLG